MTTIVNFRPHAPRKRSADEAEMLAAVARGLVHIGYADLKSKEDLQQALLFIARSNAHLREFVRRIKDDEGRARMTVQTDRIEQLVKDVRRKASAL